MSWCEDLFDLQRPSQKIQPRPPASTSQLVEGTEGPGAFVEAALDKVLACGADYLEAPEAAEAIAAAEAVARLQGHFGKRDSYSKSLDAWVEMVNLKPERALGDKARRALDRIVSAPSELLELWQDSDESGEWLASIAELKKRVDA